MREVLEERILSNGTEIIKRPPWAHRRRVHVMWEPEPIGFAAEQERKTRFLAAKAAAEAREIANKNKR